MITAIHKSMAAKRDAIKNGESDKGFTLIELLVVVLIIGILAAIAIPVFLGQQNQAKDGAAKSDLGNAKIALVSYYTATGAYTGATAATLKDYGYTATAGTSALGIKSLGTTFCINVTSGASNTFYITDSSGVTSGSCPATYTTTIL